MDTKLGRRTAMKAAGLLAMAGIASTPSAGARGEEVGQWGRPRGGALENDNFTVEIKGEETEGWREVTLPGTTTEEGEYQEGEDPDAVKQFWGQTTFDDLEMERGLIPGDTRLFDWRESVRMGDVDKGRKKLSIILNGGRNNPEIRWEFEGAWIKEYDPPDLDASADGDVATESITVAYDKMVRTEA